MSFSFFLCVFFCVVWVVCLDDLFIDVVLDLCAFMGRFVVWWLGV